MHDFLIVRTSKCNNSYFSSYSFSIWMKDFFNMVEKIVLFSRRSELLESQDKPQFIQFLLKRPM